MKVAILSNVTVEVLAELLRGEHELWLAPGFDGWRQTALAVPSELKAFAPEAVVLLLDRSHAAVEESAVASAVASLERALPRTTVLVPDLADLAEEIGSFYDERMWTLASQPWSLNGLRAIRAEIDRLLGLMTGERKKVLALDFDNTLWEGVIGEDGPSAIAPRVDFQRGLKTLRARGILLVGLSRNNAEDVDPVWNDPRMILAKDDFVDLRIDWNDKCENLASVARTLNLGLDSFVFVDDNPAERAQMAARCPEVTVAPWPVSVRRLERLYFPRLRVTDEDREKTAQYQAETKRRDLAKTLSVEEYLASLEIRVEVHPIREAEYARVAQLSQKANQFNVCTNRYTIDDVARFASDPSHLVVTAHASDRFGDQGLVAFVHLAMCDREKDAWDIVDWVMSCRAMNRRIEFTVQRWIEDELARRGAGTLRATWRRTVQNAPVRDLFERFGFETAHSSDEERRFVLNVLHIK